MNCGRAALVFPEILEIELTRRCNLACKMCQRTVVEAAASDRELSETLLATILSQCSGHSPQINLGGLGESLLHKNLPRLFAMIKTHDRTIRTGFNTNGLLLTNALDDWLLDGRVDYLSISLNAPDAPGYRRLVGSDVYAKIVRRARAFLRRKGRGSKPLTTVHTFRLAEFAERNVEFVREWRELADFVQQRELGNWAGTVDRSIFGAEPLVLGLCDRPWLSVAIDVDGGYHRCCSTFAIEKPRHSIYDVTVRDYWLGTQMNAQRRQMTRGMFEEASPCKRCSGRAIPANTVIERAALAGAAEWSCGNIGAMAGSGQKDEDQSILR